jgi:signal transduction histidine kinase
VYLNNFFTSGWDFDEDDRDLVNKFHMMNVGIVLSSIAVLYGTVLNIYAHHYSLASFEFFLFLLNVFFAFLLRRSKEYFDFVSIMVTAQFTLLLILLIYISTPQEMKHTWFYTYPIIILYFRNERHALPWFVFLISMILFAPFNPFLETQYSFYQLFYIAFVLVIVSTIVYFYKVRIDEARDVIISQEKQLSKKVAELTQKDKLLSIQSRQAVMGEMISMIAHQWRQPLSTVTLSISNLQVKKLLGGKLETKELDDTLEKISDTVVYLSDTIDDFQTYFRPDKELQHINICELIQKALSFVEPRLKKRNVNLNYNSSKPYIVKVYANELVQVLLNILNNAVDELIAREVQNPQIDIFVQEKQESLFIIIKDNAGGIKIENLEAVFEPYFSTKGKNGTGLGLYMSQMIMQKQFHTKIGVDSDERGATFSVEVPKQLA